MFNSIDDVLPFCVNNSISIPIILVVLVLSCLGPDFMLLSYALG